jgi:hypothetical protein
MKDHGEKEAIRHGKTEEVKSSPPPIPPTVSECSPKQAKSAVCSGAMGPDQETSASRSQAHGCTAENCPFRQKYFDLLEIMKEMGLMAYEMLNENQRLRLMVLQYLKREYGDIKVTPLSLHTLKPEVRNAGMAFLYTYLGGDPRAKDIVHEVFRSPRNRRRPDCTDVYR